MTPTPEHHELYVKWTQNWQFEHSVILIACKQCVRNKTNTFEALDVLLQKWLNYDLRTYADIKAYIDRKKKLDMDIRAVLDRAGENRAPTPADRRFFIQWTTEWNMPYEVVLLAAEYSIGAKNKMPFMHRILENWYNDNITTVSQAKEDHERHKNTVRSKGQSNNTLKKQVDFNRFEQHQYTDEELESLFEDIEGIKV